MSRMAVAVAAAALTIAVSACGRVDNAELAGPMQSLLGSTPEWVNGDALGKRLFSIERDFYQQRGFLPVWVDGDRPTPRQDELVSRLRAADAHGLDPADYDVEAFEQVREQSRTRMSGVRFDVERVPELDARLTYAYLRYAADLLGWAKNPKDPESRWLRDGKKEDLGALLAAALEGSIGDSLEALAPTHPQYKGLQEALAKERQASGSHVGQLRANLERWRWFPRDLGDRYILINLPAYQMQVVEDGAPVLAMRVVIGAPDTATPLFTDRMTYVVFSPYWNIPDSILRKETLPHMRDDPEYLSRNRIEVVRADGDGEAVDPEDIDWSDEEAVGQLRFRQAPGPENALGLVKFIFPNHFNVYLHDTPSRELFSRGHRALSHGCIRVEQPVALAEYVLQDRPGWTPERITAAMHAETEETVTLKTPLPVHIGYWTAWVQPDGTVAYLDDPYGMDR